MFPGKRFKFPGMSSSRSNHSSSKTPFIISFYDAAVKAKDAHGRTMEDILSWSDGHLESSHNYIQVLFPVPEGSAFNWEAPIINREVMEAFRERQDLRDQLRRSFERMVDFYGFTVKKSESEKGPDTAEMPGSTISARETDNTTTTEQLQLTSDTSAQAPTTYETNIEKIEQPDAVPSSAQSPQVDSYSLARGPKWPRNSRNWAVRVDHNHLRITRILRCLRVLGLQTECNAFFKALKDVFDDPEIRISDRSMMYWQRAVTRPLYIAPDDDRIAWLEEWEEEQKRGHSGSSEAVAGTTRDETVVSDAGVNETT